MLIVRRKTERRCCSKTFVKTLQSTTSRIVQHSSRNLGDAICFWFITFCFRKTSCQRCYKNNLIDTHKPFDITERNGCWLVLIFFSGFTSFCEVRFRKSGLLFCCWRKMFSWFWNAMGILHLSERAIYTTKRNSGLIYPENLLKFVWNVGVAHAVELTAYIPYACSGFLAHLLALNDTDCNFARECLRLAPSAPQASDVISKVR